MFQFRLVRSVVADRENLMSTVLTGDNSANCKEIIKLLFSEANNVKPLYVCHRTFRVLATRSVSSAEKTCVNNK